MAITVRDIAKEAGVSVGTASRALTGNGYTAPETKKLVLDVAEKLGYVPVKRKHPKEDPKSIGVILPDITFPFYASFLKFVEVELSLRGYKTVICSALGVQNRVDTMLKLLENKELSGIIINTDVTKAEAGRMEKLPVVSFERVLGGKIPVVSSDHREGGRLAGRLLSESGCQDVLILTTRHANLVYGDYRVDECGSYLEKQGIKYTIAEYNASLLSYRYIREVVAQYMTMYSHCDGIFTDDVSAYCCLSEAQRRGIAVPDGLKLVGYDGNELIQIGTPQITTIVQDVPVLARSCVEILTKRIAGEEFPQESLIPVTLQMGGTI